MDRAVPQNLLADILADSRRSREPSGVIPKVREPVPVPGAQAKGKNGWPDDKPNTNEPSFAERQMAKALPAQGKGGF